MLSKPLYCVCSKILFGKHEIRKAPTQSLVLAETLSHALGRLCHPQENVMEFSKHFGLVNMSYILKLNSFSKLGTSFGTYLNG